MRKQERIVVLGVVALALLARFIPGPRTIDDAYITFRYARNLLAGNGFVYNPGERVLGTTTPLYTGVMTLAGLFFNRGQAPFPMLALSLNALFDALTSVLLIHIGRKLGSWRAGLATAIIWAVLPYSVTFAIGGLETSLCILLITATIAAYLSSKPALSALAASLSLLTRPDTVIFIAPLLVDRLNFTKLFNRVLSQEDSRSNQKVVDEAGSVLPRREQPPLRHKPGLSETLLFLLPILTWFAFATVYFGSAIPHSIAAKSVAYRLPGTAALVRLIQHYATPFMGNLTFGNSWIKIGIILYPFLFLVGTIRAWRVNRRVWPWLAYPWLYFIIFAIANPLIFRWYLALPLLPYLFMILYGADHLIKALAGFLFSLWKQAPSSKISSSLALIFILILPFTLVLRDWKIHPDHGIDRPAPSMAWYQLELLYEQAAVSLEPDIVSAASAPVVAAGDIGTLGYFTSARILDTLGLISPQAVQYYPTQPEFYVNAFAVSPDLINDYQPEFVVLLEVYGREGLFKDERFNENYRLRLKIPTDIYGSDGLLVFQHN